MPEQFEKGRKLDGKNSLQDLGAKEVYLRPKIRSVSFQKRQKMFCFRHIQVFTRCSFQNVPVRALFSKSTGKNVPFSWERKAYPSNFSPFSKCAGIV